MKPDETIADIIAEKRALADGLEHEMAKQKECKELMIAHRTAQAIIENSRREADRLEAAHKRELARFDAVIDEAVHGYPPEDINDKSELSDCAKLRDAVKSALDKLLLWNYTDRDTARMALGVMNKLEAALATTSSQNTQED